MLGGAKNRQKNYKDEEFTSPAPNFPTWWGKQSQTELSATEKIKILSSPFPFCPHGSVCFTQKIEKISESLEMNCGFKLEMEGNWILWECGEILGGSYLPELNKIKLRGKGITEFFVDFIGSKGV